MGNEHSKNKGHTNDKTEQTLEKHQKGGLNSHAVSISSDCLENNVTSEAAVEQNSKPPSLPPSEETGIVEANGSGRAPVVVEQEPVIKKVLEAEPETAKTETTPAPNPQKKEPKESSKEKFKKKAKPQPIPNPDPALENEEPIKEKAVEESKSSPEVPVTVTDGIHAETSEVLMAAHLFPMQLAVRFSFPEAEPELSSLPDFLTADGIQITTESSEEQPVTSEEQPVTSEEQPTDDSVSPPEEETTEPVFGEEVTEDRTLEKSPVPKEELEEIADVLENEAAIDSAIAAELEELKKMAAILEDVADIESEELESSPSAKGTTEKNKKNDEGKETSHSSSRLLGQLQSACMKIIKESVYSPISVSAEVSTEGCGTINITLKVSLRQRGDLKCEDETATETALDLE